MYVFISSALTKINSEHNLFKESLTFSGVIVWNSIPLSIKMSPSLDIFVKRCID